MPRIRTALALTLVVATAVVAAPAAFADGGSCVPSVYTGFQAFGSYGDTSTYVAEPQNGDFESQDGWTLRYAQYTSDAYAGLGALAIQKDGRATSATFCMDATMTSLRFFAKGSGEAKVKVTVQLLVNGEWKSGETAEITLGRTWTLVPSIDMTRGFDASLLSGLPLSARIVLRADSGAVTVDEVYVDPRKTN